MAIWQGSVSKQHLQKLSKFLVTMHFVKDTFYRTSICIKKCNKNWGGGVGVLEPFLEKSMGYSTENFHKLAYFCKWL